MYPAPSPLAAIRAGIDLESDAALGALVETLVVDLPPGKVLLNGEDVSPLVPLGSRSPRSTRYAPPTARGSADAWFGLAARRFAGAEREVVTEGRDQGTIVFPDAFRKFFLTASDEERARRRHAEFVARGEPIAFESVLDDLRARDCPRHRPSHRPDATGRRRPDRRHDGDRPRLRGRAARVGDPRDRGHAGERVAI